MEIRILYIDLFCGAGGTSTGVHLARHDGDPCAKVIACVNHDANAIASHAANHPDAMHYTEDIRMRMLRIPELKRIMGFPENYVLIGTQEEQKKFIGNAVEVNMARVLCEALVAKLYELNITPQRFAA